MRCLAALTAPAGYLIMSLRHGSGSPARPCFEVDADDTVKDAAAAALKLALRGAALSVQQANRDAGVTWTWLAFRPGPPLSRASTGPMPAPRRS